jgi:hypothetical protein
MHWLILLALAGIFDSPNRKKSFWKRFWDRFVDWSLIILVTFLLGMGLWKITECVIWLFKNVKISVG